MRNIHFLVLLLLLAAPILASSSLPTLIQRYQRGDWGYRELLIDLGSSYTHSSRDDNYPTIEYMYDDDIMEDNDELFNQITEGSTRDHQFSLAYSSYHESENRCTEFCLNPSFTWQKSSTNYSQYVSYDGDSEEVGDYYSRAHMIGLGLSVDNKSYNGPNSFLAFGIDADVEIHGEKYRRHDVGYYHSYYHQEQTGDTESVLLNFGIGSGRMHDVTNLVRAQRMADRLHKRNGTELSDNQILALARKLDSQPAYQQVFDLFNNSSDLVFWQDALGEIGLNELSYDEFLDMTKEARSGTLLRRQEGGTLEAGFMCGYSHAGETYDPATGQYSDYDYIYYESLSQAQVLYGGYFELSTRNNLSANLQFGFDMPMNYLITTHSIEAETSTDEDGPFHSYSTDYDFTVLTVMPRITLLKQITDRTGLESYAGLQYHSFNEDDQSVSFFGFDVGVDITHYMSPSTRLFAKCRYDRLNYTDNDAINDGGKTKDMWDLSLQLQWRPYAGML